MASYLGITKPDSLLEPTEIELKRSQHLLEVFNNLEALEIESNLALRYA